MPTSPRPVAPTLYQRLLGAPFFTLPDAVRLLHSNHGRLRCAGRASVEGGAGPLARLCARLAGLPRASADVPLTVDFVAEGGAEHWHRDFGGMRMTSRLRARGGRLVERRGPLQFRFALHVNDGMVFWNTVGVRLFGLVPLPARLFEGVCCRERARGERYEFLVEAVLPLVGRVVRYEGWLAPVDAQAGGSVGEESAIMQALPQE
ncbi:DUF4166 domain-containing protein [Luteimonas sp. RD2P54]|uniref:DUF4166 domain-containing protein n=1 Tax=Luteimonas endophytica TaxID=3042023 RepID=A0ABT6J641_9GAMM|nr:DUF4166 domain-containing protein [Luteimonas endophytica]MDH5822301.1 DUF4166 domain-containing protein [Luteimonas endophytica]